MFFEKSFRFIHHLPQETLTAGVSTMVVSLSSKSSVRKCFTRSFACFKSLTCSHFVKSSIIYNFVRFELYNSFHDNFSLNIYILKHYIVAYNMYLVSHFRSLLSVFLKRTGCCTNVPTITFL